MTAFVQTNLYQTNIHYDRCYCMCIMLYSVVEKNKTEVFVKFVIFKCHLLSAVTIVVGAGAEIKEKDG